ncbi:alpha/beta hydrolase family protein [Nonomuraea candida]|uniref:alpha/beta hydrolase family protein n=1 Tax=Nonomuraea candida TaxID=359159 RepID=UPI000B31EC60|nr:prolyl oligopeptidase family serine peptidase [Nonomuraea candida]
MPVHPVISPDGQWVAYGEMPGTTLWIIRTDTDTPPRKLGEGTHLQWSADSQHLYYTTETRLHRQRPEGGDRTSWNTGTTAYLPLTDPRTVILLAPDPRHDDPWVWSQATGHHRLRLLDLPTGTIHTPDLFPGRHVAEVTEQPGGGTLAVLTQDSPHPDPGVLTPRLHLYDPATGKTRELGPAATSAHSLTWWNTTDGWHLAYIATTPPGITGGNAILDVPLTDPTHHHNLTQDLPACPLDLTTGGLALIADGLDSAIHRLHPATRKPTPLQPLPGQALWLTATTDGTTVAVARSHADHTRSIYTGPAHGPLTRRTDTAPELRTITWGHRQRLTYRAQDGLELDGLLILPPGKTRRHGPFSLITLAHGGPYARWTDHLHLNHHEPAQWLAADGHAVFLPNPRGGQGHGPAFAANPAPGQEEWHDLRTGIDLLIDQGIADPDRLGIAGHSHGGYLTAWAVTQTDRFKAALMSAGISDWGMLAATGELGAFEAALGGSAGWEGEGPHPHDRRSPISHAARIRTPILIVHGADDTNVPLSQAEFLHRALRRHGIEHEFVIYPREGHIITERRHRIDLLRRTRAWFSRLHRP